ncbi:hypothetical protein Q0M94_18115 (plasmid) [Deinococcus radiomollis]|uniref:RCC1 domain-containing protein n=1 Tax=Deinococcus radiomollis TaxID=468916 RepID=UPI0038926AF7
MQIQFQRCRAVSTTRSSASPALSRPLPGEYDFVRGPHLAGLPKNELPWKYQNAFAQSDCDGVQGVPMNLHRWFFVTGLLALTACSATPPIAGAPIATIPPQAAPESSVVEIEFSGIGSHFQATALRPLAAQALTDQPCVVLGSALSKSTIDLAGKRYLQATFPVTNNCVTDLKNLTYVAVRRLGAAATLGGSAITSMKTFGGTDAAVSLATQIRPTQPVYLTSDTLNVDQTTAGLQVFDDTAGGELDGLQAQVDATRTTHDLLPYGFVATSAGSRVIPAGGTGKVTFALSLPIQATPDQDVFKFNFLASPATNSITSVTQGLEEQNATGKAAVEARASALPGTEIRTLLGPALTPADVAQSSVVVCRLRTAGPRSAPSATLVNAQGTLSVVAPGLPLIIGGAQLQPSTTFTVNGSTFPTLAQYSSLTPATLIVSNNLVHPVASSPLVRQTATVQGSACGVTATATLRTSPFTPLAGGQSHSLALKSGGTVAAWGANTNGQTTVPTGLNGVVAVAAGQYHSLALKSGGTVVAWGSNSNGQTTIPAGLNGVVAVAAGQNHSLALKSDGTVIAWGSNSNGQTTVPAGLNGVVAIAAGGSQNLALKSDGTVVAWGDSSSGQTTIPAGLNGVVAIAAGGGQNLALKSDGTVVAWGRNDYGQTDVPAGLNGVVSISAGTAHSLALKSDGTVVGWGNNQFNQLSIPAGLSSVAMSAGYLHNVALQSDGTVAAWGRNDSGQTIVPAGLTVVVP